MFRLISQKYDMDTPVYTVEEIDDVLNKRGEVKEGALLIGTYSTFEKADEIKNIMIKYDNMSLFDKTTFITNFAKKYGWTEDNDEPAESYSVDYVDEDLMSDYDYNVYIAAMIQEGI